MSPKQIVQRLTETLYARNIQHIHGHHHLDAIVVEDTHLEGVVENFLHIHGHHHFDAIVVEDYHLEGVRSKHLESA